MSQKSEAVLRVETHRAMVRVIHNAHGRLHHLRWDMNGHCSRCSNVVNDLQSVLNGAKVLPDTRPMHPHQAEVERLRGHLIELIVQRDALLASSELLVNEWDHTETAHHDANSKLLERLSGTIDKVRDDMALAKRPDLVERARRAGTADVEDLPEAFR